MYRRASAERKYVPKSEKAIYRKQFLPDGTRHTHLTLAKRAPFLQYDSKKKEGTIFQRPEGFMPPQSVSGSDWFDHQSNSHGALSHHPDPFVNDVKCLRETDIVTDLELPLVAPTAVRRVWTVHGSNGSIIARIIYLPKNKDLEVMIDTAVKKVARARCKSKQFYPDEKTGGGYLVAGHGAMPGPKTVVIEGKILPFTRVSTWQAETASSFRYVAPLMGVMASAIEAHWPEIITDLFNAVQKHPIVGDAFMFPSHNAQRTGLGPGASLAVHQCALRLSGAHADETNKAVLRRLPIDSCGLHIDSGDGDRIHGVPIIYAPLSKKGTQSHVQIMSHTDLVVFEHAKGGRGVRIQVSDPRYLCAVTFSSNKQLHCNIFPDNMLVPRLPGSLLLRIVPYNISKIDDFCAYTTQRPDVWESNKCNLDLRLWLRVVAKADDFSLCVCGLNFGGPMIQCMTKGGCKHGDWFHILCVMRDDNITKEDILKERIPAKWLKRKAVWFCPFCKES